MAEFQKKLYPNCDSSVWLRSCEEEIDEPLEGKITGTYLNYYDQSYALQESRVPYRYLVLTSA